MKSLMSRALMGLAMLVITAMSSAPIAAMAAGRCEDIFVVVQPLNKSLGNFARENPKEAKKLTDELVSSELLLGQIHLRAFGKALQEHGVFQFANANYLQNGKSGLARMQTLQDAKDAVHPAKLMLEFFRSEGDTELKIAIAKTTLRHIRIMTYADTSTWSSTVERDNRFEMMAQTESLSLNRKEILRAHVLVRFIRMSLEREDFFLRSLLEANKVAAAIIEAESFSFGTRAVREAAVWLPVTAATAGPIALSVTGAMHIGAVDAAAFAGFLLGGTINLAMVHATEYGGAELYRKALAAPGNFVRRMVGKWRLKRLVSKAHGEQVARELDKRPVIEQAKLIDQAVHRDLAEFDREAIEHLKPSLDTSTVESMSRFGSVLLPAMSNLAERFEGMGERLAKESELMDGLFKRIEKGPKTSEEKAQLVAELDRALVRLAEAISDLTALQNDSSLVVRSADLHVGELQLHAQAMEHRGALEKMEFETIMTDITRTQSIVSGLAQSLDSLIGQAVAERRAALDARSALLAASITKSLKQMNDAMNGERSNR